MTKGKLEEATAYLKKELAKIRAGRASVETFEDIEVEAYGSKVPLKQVAALSFPEPRLVVIEPWDKNIIKNIESSLRSAMTDLNPVIGGDVIRVPLSPPTEERRHELVKTVKKAVEETKIKIRQIREEAMEDLKQRQEGKQISEDDFFRQKEEAQKLVDEYNRKAEEMENKKIEDIMTI